MLNQQQTTRSSKRPHATSSDQLQPNTLLAAQPPVGSPSARSTRLVSPAATLPGAQSSQQPPQTATVIQLPPHASQTASEKLRRSSHKRTKTLSSNIVLDASTHSPNLLPAAASADLTAVVATTSTAASSSATHLSLSNASNFSVSPNLPSLPPAPSAQPTNQLNQASQIAINNPFQSHSFNQHQLDNWMTVGRHRFLSLNTGMSCLGINPATSPASTHSMPVLSASPIVFGSPYLANSPLVSASAESILSLATNPSSATRSFIDFPIAPSPSISNLAQPSQLFYPSKTNSLKQTDPLANFLSNAEDRANGAASKHSNYSQSPPSNVSFMTAAKNTDSSGFMSLAYNNETRANSRNNSGATAMSSNTAVDGVDSNATNPTEPTRPPSIDTLSHLQSSLDAVNNQFLISQISRPSTSNSIDIPTPTTTGSSSSVNSIHHMVSYSPLIPNLGFTAPQNVFAQNPQDQRVATPLLCNPLFRPSESTITLNETVLGMQTNQVVAKPDHVSDAISRKNSVSADENATPTNLGRRQQFKAAPLLAPLSIPKLSSHENGSEPSTAVNPSFPFGFQQPYTDAFAKPNAAAGQANPSIHPSSSIDSYLCSGMPISDASAFQRHTKGVPGSLAHLISRATVQSPILSSLPNQQNAATTMTPTMTVAPASIFMSPTASGSPLLPTTTTVPSTTPRMTFLSNMAFQDTLSISPQQQLDLNMTSLAKFMSFTQPMHGDATHLSADATPTTSTSTAHGIIDTESHTHAMNMIVSPTMMTMQAPMHTDINMLNASHTMEFAAHDLRVMNTTPNGSANDLPSTQTDFGNRINFIVGEYQGLLQSSFDRDENVDMDHTDLNQPIDPNPTMTLDAEQVASLNPMLSSKLSNHHMDSHNNNVLDISSHRDIRSMSMGSSQLVSSLNRSDSFDGSTPTESRSESVRPPLLLPISLPPLPGMKHGSKTPTLPSSKTLARKSSRGSMHRSSRKLTITTPMSTDSLTVSTSNEFVGTDMDDDDDQNEVRLSKLMNFRHTRSRTISSGSDLHDMSGSKPSFSPTDAQPWPTFASNTNISGTSYTSPNFEDAKTPPREQKLRFDKDMYTPRWVRNQGTCKEGLCELCPPPGRWLQLKNSAFWYHKQFTHGISSISCLPYAKPVAMRIVWIVGSNIKTVAAASGAGSRRRKSVSDSASTHMASSKNAGHAWNLAQHQHGESGGVSHQSMSKTPATSKRETSIIVLMAEGQCHECHEWHALLSQKRRTCTIYLPVDEIAQKILEWSPEDATQPEHVGGPIPPSLLASSVSEASWPRSSQFQLMSSSGTNAAASTTDTSIKITAARCYQNGAVSVPPSFSPSAQHLLEGLSDVEASGGATPAWYRHASKCHDDCKSRRTRVNSISAISGTDQTASNASGKHNSGDRVGQTDSTEDDDDLPTSMSISVAHQSTTSTTTRMHRRSSITTTESQ